MFPSRVSRLSVVASNLGTYLHALNNNIYYMFYVKDPLLTVL